MKTLLAFGDSLTYGADAETGGRHAYEDRWPTVLEKGLNGAVRVIAEGLGGRTTTFDDWTSSADLNGARILPVLLKSHQPLDAVVIMLGTNDLKRYINGSALAAAMGMKRLAHTMSAPPSATSRAAGRPRLAAISGRHRPHRARADVRGRG